jgi:hypothetical protein
VRRAPDRVSPFADGDASDRRDRQTGGGGKGRRVLFHLICADGSCMVRGHVIGIASRTGLYRSVTSQKVSEGTARIRQTAVDGIWTRRCTSSHGGRRAVESSRLYMWNDFRLDTECAGCRSGRCYVARRHCRQSPRSRQRVVCLHQTPWRAKRCRLVTCG